MRTNLPSVLSIVSLNALAFSSPLACGGRVDGGSSDATSPPATSAAPAVPAPGAAPGAAPGGSPSSCEVSCDEGHTPVASATACVGGDACYPRSARGRSIVCTGPSGLCDEPACLGYFDEVKTCPAGATCETQRFCDRAILCAKSDGQCDGLPDCDEGDATAATAADCAKFGSRCYARSMCGGRIYCVRAE